MRSGVSLVLSPSTGPAPLSCDRHARYLPALIPDLRVDPGEPAQMRQVRRRKGDSISCLVGEDGVGVKSIGRGRGYARLSEKRPKLRGFDDRIGRQSQVPQAAARIEVFAF